MRARSAIFAVLLSVAGCPFSDDPDGDPATYIPVNEIEARYKAAFCTYVTRCGLYPDQATCLAANIAQPYAIDATLVNAIASGRVLYVSGNLKACFDVIAAQTCDKTDQDGRFTLPECLSFLRGTVAGGEPCFLDAECVSNQCNGGTTGTVCQQGQCSSGPAPSWVPASLHQPCNPDAGCAAGAYCDETNVCVDLKPADFSCSVDFECAYGLACSGDSVATRRCKPLPTVGQTCPEFGCRDVGTFCDAKSSPASYICEKLGFAGATCLTASACAPDYRCNFTTSKCELLPMLGQDCSQSGDCFGEGVFCGNNSPRVCMTALPDGATCLYPSECASGVCDEFQTCATPQACQL